jgi:diadenosine tetraphosphate (Ap4A) HIT family hydrolase
MKLDPRLENDSSFVTDLKLCQLRLSNNSAFPWIILIPKRSNIVEIIDLTLEDRNLLMDEIALVSETLKGIFNPTKLNVAALGNVVPQLHIHVIARFEEDKAWPGPVWNSGVHDKYTEDELVKRINQIKQAIRRHPRERGDPGKATLSVRQ